MLVAFVITLIMSGHKTAWMTVSWLVAADHMQSEARVSDIIRLWAASCIYLMLESYTHLLGCIILSYGRP
jgi:hypothetical protein